MPKPRSAAIQVGTGISGVPRRVRARRPPSSSRTTRDGPHRARADRRRRLHHAVELPAQPDRRQGRVRAGRRLHRRAQAVGGRAGQRVHPRRDHRRHRLPARRVQPRDRRRSGRRRGARRAPRRRHGVVHRFHARRASASPSSRRRRSRRSRSSSAASRRTCSSTTPTSPPRCAAGVGAAYANSGQTCSALTRMIVPRSRLAEVEAARARGGRVVHGRRSRSPRAPRSVR